MKGSNIKSRCLQICLYFHKYFEHVGIFFFFKPYKNLCNCRRQLLIAKALIWTNLCEIMAKCSSMKINNKKYFLSLIIFWACSFKTKVLVQMSSSSIYLNVVLQQSDCLDERFLGWRHLNSHSRRVFFLCKRTLCTVCVNVPPPPPKAADSAFSFYPSCCVCRLACSRVSMCLDFDPGLRIHVIFQYLDPDLNFHLMPPDPKNL